MRFYTLILLLASPLMGTDFGPLNDGYSNITGFPHVDARDKTADNRRVQLKERNTLKALTLIGLATVIQQLADGHFFEDSYYEIREVSRKRILAQSFKCAHLGDVKASVLFLDAGFKMGIFPSPDSVSTTVLDDIISNPKGMEDLSDNVEKFQRCMTGSREYIFKDLTKKSIHETLFILGACGNNAAADYMIGFSFLGPRDATNIRAYEKLASLGSQSAQKALVADAPARSDLDVVLSFEMDDSIDYKAVFGAIAVAIDIIDNPLNRMGDRKVKDIFAPEYFEFVKLKITSEFVPIIKNLLIDPLHKKDFCHMLARDAVLHKKIHKAFALLYLDGDMSAMDFLVISNVIEEALLFFARPFYFLEYFMC
jgi:hypothetical protein